MTPSEYSVRLLGVRRAAHMRRATACAMVPERVLGRALAPITPATWSLLVGTRSAFVLGTPAGFADVRNFFRFHQPEFDADQPTRGLWRRFLAYWRLERALLPLNTPRARRESVRALNLLLAIKQIRQIVEETFADSAMPGEREAGEPPRLAAAVETQFTDLFTRHYHFWPLHTPIRQTPIRVLTQMARCIDRAPYFDPAEARLDEEYLAAMNPQSTAHHG